MNTSNNIPKVGTKTPNGPRKIIIFDASTLISFAMACLLEDLKKLKAGFDGHFLITEDIKSEIVDKPIKIKRFELEALKIQDLIDTKVLEMPEVVGVKSSEISERTKKVLEITNNTFIGKKKEIELIDLGEASCLALNRILAEKKIDSVLAVDERTTRMLCEKPEDLRKFLEKKFHTKIIARKENFKIYKGIKVIRSVELVYIAYKKGLIKLKGKKVLDALLWAVKFKGCSVSGEDIEEMQRI